MNRKLLCIGALAWAPALLAGLLGGCAESDDDLTAGASPTLPAPDAGRKQDAAAGNAEGSDPGEPEDMGAGGGTQSDAGGKADSGTKADSGATDGGTKADSGATDGGTKADGGVTDGGTKPDSGVTDGGVTDSGVTDGGTKPDSGVSDGGVSDGGVSDGGVSDGGVSDGGVSDGGVTDGGVSDGGASDGGVSDAGTGTDAGSGVAPKPAQGEVLITEVMFDTTGTEPSSEWIEVYNASASARTLSGLTIVDGGNRTHVIGPNVKIAAGAYVVLARSASGAAAAKVPAGAIAYEYGAGLASTIGIQLSNGSTGGVWLRDGSTTIAQADYGGWFASMSGASVQLKTLSFSSSAQSSAWCLSDTPWTTGSDKGTPGAPSDCLARLAESRRAPP